MCAAFVRLSTWALDYSELTNFSHSPHEIVELVVHGVLVSVGEASHSSRRVERLKLRCVNDPVTMATTRRLWQRQVLRRGCWVEQRRVRRGPI